MDLSIQRTKETMESEERSIPESKSSETGRKLGTNSTRVQPSQKLKVKIYWQKPTTRAPFAYLASEFQGMELQAKTNVRAILRQIRFVSDSLNFHDSTYLACLCVLSKVRFHCSRKTQHAQVAAAICYMCQKFYESFERKRITLKSMNAQTSIRLTRGLYAQLEAQTLQILDFNLNLVDQSLSAEKIWDEVARFNRML